MTTLTQNEFEQDPDAAMRASAEGPVFILDDGEPRHVLLSFDAYQRAKNGKMTLAEAMSMPGLSDIDLDVPDFRDSTKSVDFP